MADLTVLTFELQRTFWKLLREYGEGCKDVALHPAHSAAQGSERAGHRYDKARSELSSFVESITEKPKKVKP